MLKLFEYLGASTLLTAACVCNRWHGLATENSIWINIYKKYAKVKGNQAVKDSKLPLSYWKNLCLKRCSEDRNKSILKLMKKTHPFTGLPTNTKLAMTKSGIYYHLRIIDRNGQESSCKSAGIFWHSMSVCVRWYNLQTVPLKNIRKIQILSCNPLFFDNSGTAINNSPYQRSLLTECSFKWEVWKRENKAIKEDENVQLYRLSDDILIATWKADEELAFIVTGFHQENLVKRCLLGSSQIMYELPEHKVILDDIDSSYGLHHYTCTVEIRNMRQSIWSQQFQSIECKKENIENNVCKFVLMRRDRVIDRVTVAKEIELPWKTDLFKGVVKDVCWLDITLLDERGEVFWTTSCPVYARTKETVRSIAMDFEYDNESKLEIVHQEENVDVLIELNEMDDGKRFITHLEINVDTQMIDSWFGTSYTPPIPKDKLKNKLKNK
ncbi:F-box only protein 15 [Patella vulgata]|uniref:F-box only protein 15 n=1 Tax=Patella vulgata TaxID=6465 RepID=UPI00217FA762|nr:F-box only protein 15 [Patella vulgata]